MDYSKLIPTGVDTESLLIRPGLQNPPIVCASVAVPGRPTELYPSPDYRNHVHEFLGPDRLLYIHNAPFDCWGFWIWAPGAKELIRQAFRDRRIICTQVLQRLGEITTSMPKSSWSLAVLCERYKISTDEGKTDGTRMTYGQYLGKPLSAYTPDHVRYAKRDAENHLELGLKLTELFGSTVPLEAAAYITYRMFCFNGYRNYGIKTSRERTKDLAVKAQAEFDRLAQIGHQLIPLTPQEAEEIRKLEAAIALEEDARKLERLEKQADEIRLVRRDLSGNTNRIRAFVDKAYNGKAPKTKAAKGRTSTKPFKPQTQTGHDVLFDSGDPFLMDFADFQVMRKVLSADVKMLQDGWITPIHTRYSIADTLRIISSGPNLTNLRVESGIRDAFEPRPGTCYVEFDHSALEFVCVAQICKDRLGFDDLCRQVREKIDPHCITAAVILGCSYEEAKNRVKVDKTAWEARQASKVVAYGGLGGMSDPETLAKYARKYKISKPPVFWSKVLAAWKKAQPVCAAYLQSVHKTPRTRDGRYIPTIPGLELQRWGSTKTAALNTPFQGLGAVIESEVAIQFHEAQQDLNNVLSVCHCVSQVHDSFQFEVPVKLVTEAYNEIYRIMTSAPRKYLKDTPIEAEGLATFVQSKAASLKIADDGEVLIWAAPDLWVSGKSL